MTDDVESNDDDEQLGPSPDALSLDELNYPEFVFGDGQISADGAFDLRQGLSREELVTWLRDLADGLESHDIAVESPDGHVTFGVGAGDVTMSFDPEEDYTGTLSIGFDLRAKAMVVADDPTKRKPGARGNVGFIPETMLTEDDDSEQYRCYNWIDDPTDP